MTLRRSALSVCPCGDPWGTLLQLEITYSRAPTKPPQRQTLRSPRPKVTSVLTRQAKAHAKGTFVCHKQTPASSRLLPGR